MTLDLLRLLGVQQKIQLPSGKHTKNYGKSPFVMGKSTISMAIFNSELFVYQRVTKCYTGWWFQPSWKIWVNGKDDIPYMKWKIKAMFQTTNQKMLYQWNPHLKSLPSSGTRPAKGDRSPQGAPAPPSSTLDWLVFLFVIIANACLIRAICWTIGYWIPLVFQPTLAIKSLMGRGHWRRCWKWEQNQ